MRIALHTRVREDRIASYEAAHREVPTELTTAIRADLLDYSETGTGAGLPVVWDL